MTRWTTASVTRRGSYQSGPRASCGQVTDRSAGRQRNSPWNRTRRGTCAGRNSSWRVPGVAGRPYDRFQRNRRGATMSARGRQCGGGDAAQWKSESTTGPIPAMLTIRAHVVTQLLVNGNASATASTGIAWSGDAGLVYNGSDVTTQASASPDLPDIGSSASMLPRPRAVRSTCSSVSPHRASRSPSSTRPWFRSFARSSSWAPV